MVRFKSHLPLKFTFKILLTFMGSLSLRQSVLRLITVLFMILSSPVPVILMLLGCILTVRRVKIIILKFIRLCRRRKWFQANVRLLTLTVLITLLLTVFVLVIILTLVTRLTFIPRGQNTRLMVVIVLLPIRVTVVVPWRVRRPTLLFVLLVKRPLLLKLTVVSETYFFRRGVVTVSVILLVGIFSIVILIFPRFMSGSGIKNVMLSSLR